MGVGHTVEKQDDPMEDADGGQVGGTGGEGFVESTLGRHPSDGDDDERIGSKDDQEAARLVERRND